MKRADDESNVIPLAEGRGGPQDGIAQLESYWHRLCDGRLMPDRHEVDPRGLSDNLDRVFLIERLAPGVTRFRLAGQHLCDLMGMDVRGMPLTAFFLPSARAEIAEASEAVFAEPARVELTLEGPRGMMRGRMAGRMLLLPLRDRAGGVTRALGAMIAAGPSIRAPQRFEVVAQQRRTLIGYGQRPPRPATGPKLRPVSVD